MGVVTLHDQGGGAFITTQTPTSNTAFVNVQPVGVSGTIDLKQAFDSGACCFVNSIPKDWTKDDWNRFATQVRAGGFVPSGQVRYFVWIDDPAKWLDPSSPHVPEQVFQVTTPGNQIIIPPGSKATFSARSSELTIGNWCSVALSEDGTGFAIDRAERGDIKLTTASTSMLVKIDTATIHISDDVQGQFEFTGSFTQSDLETIGARLQYVWKTSPGAKDAAAIRYPVFSLPDKATVPLVSHFDPWRLTDRTRTYFSFGTVAPGSLSSYLRTLLGRVVTLTPVTSGDNPATLQFTPGPYATGEDFTHLAPCGDFVVGIGDPGPTGDTKYRHRLLCGLSGTEYISMTPGEPGVGDVLRFFLDQKACASCTVDSSTNPRTIRFADFGDEHRTSWAMLLPAAQSSQRDYYAEPNSGAFFSQPSKSSGDVLDYLPVSVSPLPDAPPPPPRAQCFPLVPYAAPELVEKLPPAYGADVLGAFEQQILSPTRKNSIADLIGGTGKTVGIDASASGAVIAITPGGTLNRFTGGKWDLIRFAELDAGAQSNRGMRNHRLGASKAAADGNQYFDFAPAAGSDELPGALQNAFLTNQLFLVASVDNGNLGTMTPLLEMNGWSFNLTPPKTPTVGDYRNVLIFKSARGRITDFVADPTKWTAFGDFNDKSLDPDGSFISQWISDYISQTVAAYDGGDGNTEFQNFCELVEDPGWSGLLVLRSEIDPGTLSDELLALTAGIDMSRFYAHHIGNEVTRAMPDTSGKTLADLGFELNSAIFALVYYTDPSYQPGTKGVPAIQMSSDTYDFKVLSLVASFEKATLKTFGCKLMLLMNEMFSSAVAQTSLDPSVVATNRILLDGSAVTRDGVTVYTFATPPHTESNFYTAGTALTEVRIDRAEFGVQSTSGSVANGGTEHLATTFSMWGSLAFSAGPLVNPSSGTAAMLVAPGETPPMFDVWSYESLAFSNLSVKMTFDLSEPGGVRTVSNRQFVFDCSRMTFDPLPLQIGNVTDADRQRGFNYAREWSFLSQFPLKLKRFVMSTPRAGTTPEAMGYGAITAPPLRLAGLTGKLGDTWYGMECQLGIGSMGAMASNSVLTADMLLAWDPESGNWYVGMKFPGLGPIDKLIDLEGVVKFGAQEVLFDLVLGESPHGQYVIKFASIGLSLLSVTFPAKGSTNVVLFGDPADHGSAPPTTLAWFGSYVQPKPNKPQRPGTRAKRIDIQ